MKSFEYPETKRGPKGYHPQSLNWFVLDATIFPASSQKTVGGCGHPVLKTSRHRQAPGGFLFYAMQLCISRFTINPG